MRHFRNTVRLSLVPVVATGGTAGLAQGVNAQAPHAVVGHAPAGASIDTLCQPFYGSGKEIGISMIVEGVDGEPLSSLDGYTFELRGGDGSVYPITAGTGTGKDQPANISTRTATSSNAWAASLGLFGAPIFYLNCFPSPDPTAPYPEGTVLVALKDGVVVSSGSLAGRFAPSELDGGLFSLVESFIRSVDSSVDPCDTASVTSGYRTLTEATGLTHSDAIADAMAVLQTDPSTCSSGAFAALLDTLLAQAFFHDGPRGLLSESPVLPASATIDWDSYGHRQAVLIDSLVTDGTDGSEEDNALPKAGATLWFLSLGGAALVLVGATATRRRTRPARI